MLSRVAESGEKSSISLSYLDNQEMLAGSTFSKKGSSHFNRSLCWNGLERSTFKETRLSLGKGLFRHEIGKGQVTCEWSKPFPKKGISVIENGESADEVEWPLYNKVVLLSEGGRFLTNYCVFLNQTVCRHLLRQNARTGAFFRGRTALLEDASRSGHEAIPLNSISRIMSSTTTKAVMLEPNSQDGNCRKRKCWEHLLYGLPLDSHQGLLWRKSAS